MKHAARLDLVLTHAFYANGLCPDFAIEADEATARLLARHRLTTVPLPSGLRVVTPLDGVGAPLLTLDTGAHLRFYLRLRNNDFSLFTDLSAVSALSSPLFTTAGVTAGATMNLALVADAAARPPGVLAAVEIRATDLPAWPEAPRIVVAFVARQWRWAYYCLTDLPSNGDEITIVDTSPAGPDVLQFSDANRTPLDASPDPSDAVGAQLVGRFPGMRCVRILSDQAVTCREAPRGRLELRRGVDRLAGPLSNPSVRSFTRVGATPLTEDVLYQIVKYRANPFV